MGFGQGLSGLRAQSQKLDVIGNNIANAGTVGFKSSTVSFADVYASSRVGLGTQVAAVNQAFTMGNVTSTGGQFDIAIDGDRGLFRVLDPNGNILYTRNGEFHANKEGYLVNSQGYRLTGFPAGSTAPEPIRVPSGNIAPKATNRITAELNLDSSVDPIDTSAADYELDPLDPKTFHHSLPVTIYDSQGNSHQLTQYFIKTDANDWEVRYVIPGLDGAGEPSLIELTESSRLVFTGGGILDIDDPLVDPKQSSIEDLADILDQAGLDIGVDQLDITLGYSGSTQFSGEFSYNFDQSGFPTGEYSSMSIGPDGRIIAAYTNGEIEDKGYLVLAHFNNLQGLQPVGSNAWRETSESGQPILGTPGTNGMAQVKGQALEESNVDMGNELVNLIVTQRTYQANAQTITTQSEVLQTLLNIR